MSRLDAWVMICAVLNKCLVTYNIECDPKRSHTI